jgi:hypothetical protein
MARDPVRRLASVYSEQARLYHRVVVELHDSVAGMYGQHQFFDPGQHGDGPNWAQEAANTFGMQYPNERLLEAQLHGASMRMQEELAMQLASEAAYLRDLHARQLMGLRIAGSSTAGGSGSSSAEARARPSDFLLLLQ